MPDDIGPWLAANAVPLRTLSAEGALEELEPLREPLNDVRIIGMGESTHGTREFFQLKHRLLRFLVLEMGCTALAMEASESAARAVDAYVHGGPGDAARLLDRLGFWTWRTEEVRDMVEWMREHNGNAPVAEQVSFVGVDPQRCADSVAVVRAFLLEVAPQRDETDFLDVLTEARPGSRPDPGQRLRVAAEDLVAFLVSHRGEFAGRTSADAADAAVWHAGALVRAADLVTRPLQTENAEDSAMAVRDRYMAEAITSLVAATGGRIAVWGHNGHVATGTYANGVVSLGSRLRQQHGEAYYALGLLFGEGSFNARRGDDLEGDAVAHRVGRSGRTIESRFATAVRGDYLIDFRTVDPESAAGRWLRDSHNQRSFGSNVPRLTYRFHVAPVVPAQEYDGIAFVARSTCSRPLPPLSTARR
ncbi:erythromycin esterase family protein [Desertihabitans aurantiacus]|uniref:erythromycin esterase family protein n=1 Tax=Desertihabitans aurantiacus TaxID=2282477 RepID=UPI000DF72142|nr:erythromycin esterase family protein [Desertihabitans aurantiacus]